MEISMCVAVSTRRSYSRIIFLTSLNIIFVFNFFSNSMQQRSSVAINFGANLDKLEKTASSSATGMSSCLRSLNSSQSLPSSGRYVLILESNRKGFPCQLHFILGIYPPLTHISLKVVAR
ncbi:hypothetical protein CsSME_00024412 [Camellia sinensis var. sinensis]